MGDGEREKDLQRTSGPCHSSMAGRGQKRKATFRDFKDYKSLWKGCLSNLRAEWKSWTVVDIVRWKVPKDIKWNKK